MNKFSKVVILVCVIITTYQAKAQDWMGFYNSNYAGVYGIGSQPASIADSRYKFQINLVGFSSYTSNNLYQYPLKDLRTNGFDDDKLKRTSGHNNHGMITSLDALAPLSFMVSMSPKHSFAITARARGVINVEGIDDKTAAFIDKNRISGKFAIDSQESYDLSNVYGQGQGWIEYGATYARVIIDQDAHFLKGGTTLKLLSGQASGYTFIKDLRYNGEANDLADIANVDVQAGYSSPYIGVNEVRPNLLANPGFGFDLGAVYEFRPNKEDYKYDMDGETGIVPRHRNIYKYRVGFSLLDVGGIKYDKDPNFWQYKRKHPRS